MSLVSYLEIHQRGFPLAAVNFDIPDDLADAFHKALGGQDHNAVIVEMMRRVVHAIDLPRQRVQLFDRLSKVHRRSATAEQIRDARNTRRP